MSHDAEHAKKQVDDLLNIPCQSWLLGAGISKEAGIPLMYPLTERVEQLLASDKDDLEVFTTVRGTLEDCCHVEHVLSHLGDLIAIAERSKAGATAIGKKSYDAKFLRSLHAKVQNCIRDTIRWGYRPSEGGKSEEIGTADKPIVSVDQHVAFVRSLFFERRAGLDRRPAVTFFTTNYDTLLEDAFALGRIKANDGFHGGAMAFWEPGSHVNVEHNTFMREGYQARIWKLHGSIDWYASEEDVVVRLREGASYPSRMPGRLLIYPQATKYQVTQKDPFAAMFSLFRATLSFEEQSVLIVCGYSFCDDHINGEIERAIKQRGNRLTVLALVHQGDGDLPANQGLPSALTNWLANSATSGASWKEKIVVAGRRGIYHGSLSNLCPAGAGTVHDWWSFKGITNVLSKGTGARV